MSLSLRENAGSRCSSPKPFSLSPGWFFISPWLLGFLVFSVVPFLGSLYLSFCRYDILSSPRFIGVANYRQLFLHDPLFWKALYNTLFYTAFAVPLSIVTALALAMLLNADIRGISVYRTIFFLPSIVPMVASSILWIWILNPQIGLINTLLAKVGIS
ncbi:sugar ABC transporter permease, partial [Candidatus Sumerlaeota bacterium]|nr:sugar ABC transporter permease [Candidatus Sumerlaeota bacterium]